MFMLTVISILKRQLDKHIIEDTDVIQGQSRMLT